MLSPQPLSALDAASSSLGGGVGAVSLSPLPLLAFITTTVVTAGLLAFAIRRGAAPRRLRAVHLCVSAVLLVSALAAVLWATRPPSMPTLPTGATEAQWNARVADMAANYWRTARIADNVLATVCGAQLLFLVYAAYAAVRGLASRRGA
jgi:hypothetical protein